MAGFRTVVNPRFGLAVIEGTAARASGGAASLNHCDFTAALDRGVCIAQSQARSEEHTSELQSLMRISYAGFCAKKKQVRVTYQAKDHNYIFQQRLPASTAFLRADYDVKETRRHT